MPDGKLEIAVGNALVLRVEKPFAGYFGQYIENVLIKNVPGTYLLFNHITAGELEIHGYTNRELRKLSVSACAQPVIGRVRQFKR
jgi:hypothetical protein